MVERPMLRWVGAFLTWILLRKIDSSSVVYDPITYADFQTVIDRSLYEGPGEFLFTDVYLGKTISRQSFRTQFVLDLQYSLGVNTSRVHVLNLTAGGVHWSWYASTVIVSFRLFERAVLSEASLLDVVRNYTAQIQDPHSKLYDGNVTECTNASFGLQSSSWDASLRLAYAIEVVGGAAVKDGYYLNQGSLLSCDFVFSSVLHSYCEFESMFEDDIAKATNISTSRVATLFVKKAAPDSVLVHFRILPPRSSSPLERSILDVMQELQAQLTNASSRLFMGNVTLRTDSTWGLSQSHMVPRKLRVPYGHLHYKRRGITEHDRCKAVQRCNWGEIDLNQTDNAAAFYQRLFSMGEKYSISMYADFDDWRAGLRGFVLDGGCTPTVRHECNASVEDLLPHAHFSFADFASIGPVIPAVYTEENRGLVLNNASLQVQIEQQTALVDDLQSEHDWMTENIEIAMMDSVRRSRKDVRRYITEQRDKLGAWLAHEQSELRQLSTSQCRLVECHLLFNTSSFQLTGAINATGRSSWNDGRWNGGRSVPVRFYLPGTAGGFPGGYSVARHRRDMYVEPRDITLCEWSGHCPSNSSFDGAVSSNVNGPGSGSVRVLPFTLRTSADHIHEVQTITTSAAPGQTLAGGFTVEFGPYSSRLIHANATARDVKRILEEDLNAQMPATDVMSFRKGRVAGVGLLDVTRARASDAGGYRWTVTFTSAIGNIQQMRVKSHLVSWNAAVRADTLRDGNEIGGSFTLTYRGATTRPISATVTADVLKDTLLEEFEGLQGAYVERSDPLDGLCDDGLCPNGPGQARDLVWSVYVTTCLDNVTPSSPTSVSTLEAGSGSVFSVTGRCTGYGAGIQLDFGLARSTDDAMSALIVRSPFSLAFGGAGASHGGRGGRGYGAQGTAAVYSNEAVTDLVGGSGGCLAGTQLSLFSLLKAPAGRGGAGGGAVEIVANNDIIIGSSGAIHADGGDGAVGTQGGGGGGSGGAVLLVAGASMEVAGAVTARGGDGGSGGSKDLAGGGGGGGRIAMFAQALKRESMQYVSGGRCGVATSIGVSTNVVATADVCMYVPRVVVVRGSTHQYSSAILKHVLRRLPTPLSGTWAMLSVQHHNSSALPWCNYIGTASLTRAMDAATWPSATSVLSNLTVTTQSALSWYLPAQANSIKASMSSELGLQALRDEALMLNVSFVNLSLVEGELTTKTVPFHCDSDGSSGSVHVEEQLVTDMYVDTADGAEGSLRSLVIRSTLRNHSSSGVSGRPYNGPVFRFSPTKPGRVSFYTKLGALDEHGEAGNAVVFALLGGGADVACGCYRNRTTSAVVGVEVRSDGMFHGTDFIVFPDERVVFKTDNRLTADVAIGTWYKVDVFFDWSGLTYRIALNDAVVLRDASFKPSWITGVGIFSYLTVQASFDQIYVGEDNTMNFTCADVTRTGARLKRPPQFGWPLGDIDGDTFGKSEYSEMMRHYSHLNTEGKVAFDGQGHLKLEYDIKSRPLLPPSYEGQGLATLSYDSTVGRFLWYGDHTHAPAHSSSPFFGSAIAACSTEDFLSWRFEGLVFRNTNLSDMVYGQNTTFTVQRPVRLHDNATDTYVIWATMENPQRDLGQAVVLSSSFYNGPFELFRSFYPDGNVTKDQVVYTAGEKGFLARTYYTTVEYVMPAAIMQPIWESVQQSDGTTNFRLSYHRAHYDEGYDNYHDIYLQRWRKEDKAFEVICVNKITGMNRTVTYAEAESASTICIDPDEYKVVIGLGYPAVTSRFLDPANSTNSFWMASSVPAVQAQPWEYNYKDGICGIHKTDMGYDTDAPELEDFTPTSRGSCSNILDNPIHATPPDKLIGLQRVVEARRAKFIAVSRLTDDYMDVSGWLQSIEGEAENDLYLADVSLSEGGFGWLAGSEFLSTFQAPVSIGETASDYITRFHQYEATYNDRAEYSLSCTIDGECPVDYAAQIDL